MDFEDNTSLLSEYCDYERKFIREDITQHASSSALKFPTWNDIRSFLQNSASRKLCMSAVVFNPVNSPEEVNLHMYISLALQFAQDFGDQVKELELNFSKIREPTELYKFFVAIVGKLPNLKTLHLDFRLDVTFIKPGSLQTIISKLGWPESDAELELLNAKIEDYNDMVLMEPLIYSYANQVQTLCVTPFTWFKLSTHTKRRFTHLKVFNIFWKYNQTGKVPMNLLYTTIFPDEFALKIETIRLLNTCIAREERPLSWLFGVLTKFPDLKLLNLTGFVFEADAINLDEYRINSTLTTLKFQDSQSTNYDFLIKLTKLHTIFIEGQKSVLFGENEKFMLKDSRVGKIDLRSFLYMNNLQKSNVWTMVPSVKKIVFQRYVAPSHIPGKPLVFNKRH